MEPWVIVLIVIFAILLIGIVVLTIMGKKMQDKKALADEQMRANAQTVSMLIIDKKMMRLQDAKLPDIVMQQTPKRYQKSKMPIVKAKVGPNVMNLICDVALFDDIPVKKEVKALVSGLYIVEIKSIRGGKVEKTEPQKKDWKTKLAIAQSKNEKKLRDLKQEQEQKQSKNSKGKDTKNTTNNNKNTKNNKKK